MIKKIIITLFFLFTLFVFNNQYQAKAEDEENTTSTSTPPAPILIISSTDNDFGNTIYNSEDKNKLFGCFNFWASSSEDVLLKDITLLVRDSFSSNFINPEVEKIIDLENLQKNIIFNNINTIVPKLENKKLCVYADISKNIVDEVASKIDIISDNTKAIGLDYEKQVIITGSSDGQYIKLQTKIEKPDLIVTGIRVSQGITQNNLVAGKKTFITVFYKNIGAGNMDENFPKKISFNPKSAFEFSNDDKPSSVSGAFESSPGIISPGEEFMEIYEGIFSNPGNMQININIDSENTINESDNLNNFYSEGGIRIDSELDYPDFTIEDIIIEPKRPKARELVKIDVVYKNLGSDFARDLNEYLTSVYFGHIEGYFIFEDNMPMTTNRPIPSEQNPWLSGETYIQTYYGHFNRPRQVTLEAKIDLPNKVMELSEENNEFSKIVEIINQNSGSLSEKLKGKIILRVERKGEAYYINPRDKSIHSLGRPEEAFSIMREQGIGIANQNLEQISIGIGGLEGIDTDEDGLPDAFEDVIGTDKTKKDTDGDGYSDKTEIEQGYNPRANNGAKKITNSNFTSKQLGKIFLQVENNGEAWYVNPDDEKRYFLGRPSDAFKVMRNLGLGINEINFESL